MGLPRKQGKHSWRSQDTNSGYTLLEFRKGWRVYKEWLLHLLSPSAVWYLVRLQHTSLHGGRTSLERTAVCGSSAEQAWVMDGIGSQDTAETKKSNLQYRPSLQTQF